VQDGVPERAARTVALSATYRREVARSRGTAAAHAERSRLVARDHGRSALRRYPARRPAPRRRARYETLISRQEVRSPASPSRPRGCRAVDTERAVDRRLYPARPSVSSVDSHRVRLSDLQGLARPWLRSRGQDGCRSD
jgi:hypothetical protein